MKKIFKKIGLIAVFLSLLIPMSYVKAFNSDEKLSGMDRGLKKYLGNNYEERIKNNTLSAENIEKIESMFARTNSNRTIYPNYIGGFYIDDSDDRAVIQLVKENEFLLLSDDFEDFELYKNILSIDKNIKIKYVDYSYNDINSVIDVLANYYSKNYEVGNIDSYHDDVINNRVVVELKNYSDEAINDFRKTVIDSPLIYFTKSKKITGYVNYNPGGGILPVGCSIGFRAKLGNAIGLVTAGHCVSGVNQKIDLFGEVKKYRKEGDIDASWVSLDLNHSISNLLQYHPHVGLPKTLDNTPVTSFIIGQIYGKAGVTSHYTYGKITSLNSSGAGGITGLVGTNVYANRGDSGGIVFKISGTGDNPTSYQTAGIVQGGPESGGDMVFTKASRIVSNFGINTY